MFKKPFSVLAAFALGLVISVSIMACADNLQYITTCNCDNTIKDLLNRIDALEKKVNKIEEPNYDALVQLVVDRLNSSAPSTGNSNVSEERIAAIEQEVNRLKDASKTENISSYKWSDGTDYESLTCTYDELGRLSKLDIKVAYDGEVSTDTATCSYNGNVCTLTYEGESDVWTFTLSDKDSQNFNIVKQAILAIHIQ